MTGDGDWRRALGEHWQSSPHGVWVPSVSGLTSGREKATTADTVEPQEVGDASRQILAEARDVGSNTSERAAFPHILGLVGSVATAIGAIIFAFTWAYFNTFYSVFGISPEWIGLDFAAIGARAVFLMFWFWAPVAILAVIKVSINTPRLRFLSPGIIISIGAIVFCISVMRTLGRNLLNPGNYSLTLFLYILCLLGFMLWRSNCVESGKNRWRGRVLDMVLACISIAAVAQATYGLAEAAATLATDEAQQVKVVGFPNEEILSATRVNVYPSGRTEGEGFLDFIASNGDASKIKGERRMSKSTLIDKIVRGQKCVLLLGSSNDTTYLWLSGIGFIGPGGSLLAVPSDEIIVNQVPDLGGSGCKLGSQNAPVQMPLITLG